MITIEKGNHKIICSKLAYEEQFKSLGYQIASENKGAAEKTEAPLFKKEEEKDIKKINKDEEKEQIKAKYGLNKKKK